MNRLLTTPSFPSLLITVALTAPVCAQDLTPFVNGTPANADQVNANFNALKTAVQAAQTAADNQGMTLSNLTGAITVTAPQIAVDRRLQFPATHGNRKIVLNGTLDNDHEFSGFGTANNVLRYQTAGGSDHVFYTSTSPTESNELLRMKSSGDVRLGAPGAKLQFGADGLNGQTVSLYRFNSGANDGNMYLSLGNATTGYGFIIQKGGSNVFFFSPSGDAYKPGGGAWAVSSDVRLKQDIAPLGRTLDRLLRLEGKTYTYKNPADGVGTQTGFIAQEVAAVFPNWVSERSDGMKMVSIKGFEALSVEAMRELDARDHRTDERVARLESENAELKNRVANLEALAAEFAALKASLQPLLAK